MATIKHVTDAALEAALQVVKGKMPKAGTGLSVDSNGTWGVVLSGIEVDPGNIAAATTTTRGVVQVGNGLSVAAGVISTDDSHINTLAQAKVDALALKTVNGQSIKGAGDITIDLSLYKVVDTLPTSGIDDNKIYLVRNSQNVPDGELNVYVEYMHVGSSWEKVGEYKSAFDPSDLKADIKTAQDTANAAKTAAAAAQGTADSAKTTAEKAASDIAALTTKYPNLTATLASKSYVDETFVKASELEALCMTAADGTALANTVFA